MLTFLVGLGIILGASLLLVLFGRLYKHLHSQGDWALVEVIMWAGAIALFVAVPVGVFFLAMFLGGLVT